MGTQNPFTSIYVGSGWLSLSMGTHNPFTSIYVGCKYNLERTNDILDLVSEAVGPGHGKRPIKIRLETSLYRFNTSSDGRMVILDRKSVV